MADLEPFGYRSRRRIMNLTEKFLAVALGGAEWVLWLLVLLSVMSVYVMVERFMFLRGVSRSDRGARGEVLAALEAGEPDRARGLLKNALGPGGRMIDRMLSYRGRGEGSLRAALDATRPEERIRLEGNLSFLGTLGANAPFVGLFGTVLGIIKAFKDLADSGLQAGGDNSAVVMAGISEALVATAVGLLVAIPAVVAYNAFQRKVKRLLAEAEAFANLAFASLGEPGSREDA